MTLSSRHSNGCGLVDGVVAQHGPQDVEASAGQGEDGVGMGFAFEAFSVVVGARGRVGADGDLGGQVAGAEESSVVAAGASVVAVDAAGVTRYRGQSGDAGQAVHGVEGGQVAAGGGKEFGAEGEAESGHAQDDLGVAVAAKSVLYHRFGVGDFGVEGHHLLSLAGDHGGGELLSGDGGALRIGSSDRGSGDDGSVAGLAFTQPRFQASGTSATQSVGGLIAGQQNQGGLVVAVVEGPLECGEVLQQ